MTDAMNARYGQNDTSIEKITKTKREMIYLTFQGMRLRKKQYLLFSGLIVLISSFRVYDKNISHLRTEA